MTNDKMIEINAAALRFALDVIREQKAAGADVGFPQKRSATIVARTVVEMLDSYPMPEGYADGEDKWRGRVVFASLATGPLMQGSTMQKAAVKAGIYEAAAALAGGYGI